MNNIIEIFSYTFMIRALISGILISLCASLIGVSIVLRRNSMIGDGLSHVAFMTFALATILHVAPLYFSIPIGFNSPRHVFNLSPGFISTCLEYKQ